KRALENKSASAPIADATDESDSLYGYPFTAIFDVDIPKPQMVKVKRKHRQE
ncbi:unnamed protein product, partial [Peniophora sp. CBMAI 1063]